MFREIAGEPASGYGPPAGLPELRTVLANWVDPGRADPRRVMVTHGAKGGLLALLAALVEPGDEVIHPLPCYPAYPAMVRRFGGVPMGVAEHGDGFAGWSDRVLAIAGPRTRAVVLSSPSNPSGATIDGGELQSLVDGCGDRGIRLILDEAYSAFCFADEVVDPATVVADSVLVRVGSASKSLAIPGWRMGWIVADEELVKRVTGVQSALLNPPATPPQRALLALPDVPEAISKTTAARFSSESRPWSRPSSGPDSMSRCRRAASIRGSTSVIVSIHRSRTPRRGARRLAEEHGVGLWPGEDYGTPGWVRLALPQGEGWRDVVAELEVRLSR